MNWEAFRRGYSMAAKRSPRARISSRISGARPSQAGRSSISGKRERGPGSIMSRRGWAERYSISIYFVLPVYLFGFYGAPGHFAVRLPEAPCLQASGRFAFGPPGLPGFYSFRQPRAAPQLSRITRAASRTMAAERFCEAESSSRTALRACSSVCISMEVREGQR